MLIHNINIIILTSQYTYVCMQKEIDSVLFLVLNKHYLEYQQGPIYLFSAPTYSMVLGSPHSALHFFSSTV